MEKWIFKIKNTKEALNFYNENGYVGFSDLISLNQNKILCDAFDSAINNGVISQGYEDMIAIDDAVYASDEFMSIAKNKKIVDLVKAFLNSESIELQHSKINSKPISDNGSGLIKWHQDYPFFPHTNHDLLAFGIHLDDEDENSGSLRVIPRSHINGPLSHCDENGNFTGYCTENNNINEDKSKLLVCPAGTVTIHNCYTLHQSDPKTNNLKRRLFVNQYRTSDNAQLGGPIWKCTGINISGNKNKGKIRFMDGTVIENRGNNGSLYDLFGKLAPKE